MNFQDNHRLKWSILLDRQLSDSTGFSTLEVPAQALDGLPLGMGLVMKVPLYYGFYQQLATSTQCVGPPYIACINWRLCSHAPMGVAGVITRHILSVALAYVRIHTVICANILSHVCIEIIYRGMVMH